MDRSKLRWPAGVLALATALAWNPAPAAEPLQFAQLVVREQIVVRLRTQPAAPAPAQWKEGKGVKCIPARAILGAAMVSQNSVDLVMRDRSRVRARLESSCPALDYYYGFYIRPNADGMICADRDIIRSRMGGQCGIDRLRTLEIAARK